MAVDVYPQVPLVFEELEPGAMLDHTRNLLSVMQRRRSVRQFSDRPVPRELIECAIATAGTAPSGAHREPWHFVVISGAELKSEIRKAAEAEEKESYARRMPEAWLKAIAPLGTDWHKPFLEIAPWLVVCFAKNTGDDGLKNYLFRRAAALPAASLLRRCITWGL